MPTYEYICKNCGHELEELQSMKEPALVKCPECGQETLARIMSSGSGLIFKGSGFYKTDYLKSEEKKSPSTPKADDTKKSDTKPGPSESKPDTSPPPPPPPPSSPKKDS